MMRRLGDKAGREVLREHEELTRRMLREHGGDEVKTMGDGFMASFASVNGAVECAIAMQTGVRGTAPRPGRRAGQGADPRPDRAERGGADRGGRGFLRGGGDHGVANRGAGGGRGDPGVGRDPRVSAGKGFLFADRGENVLRGFEDAVRVWEVRWRE